VLEQGVARQHVVVRLHHGSGHLGSRGHGEGQLGLAAVVHRQTLQQKRAEARSSSTAGGVEDHEALETSAVVRELADAVQNKVHDLLANGVVAASVVVGGIFLAGDELLGVVQLAVSSSADLVTNAGLQVDENSSGNMLASTSLGEKGVEGIIAATNSLVGRHLAVRLDAVLQAVKLPAGISGLDTSLANVDR